MSCTVFSSGPGRKELAVPLGDWRKDAACRPQIAETNLTYLFYTEDLAYIAKQICIDCPVAFDCHEEATINGELGVWGGLTANERRARQRRRA